MLTALARGSALRVTNLLATVVVSLCLVPFIVHALGDRAYGMWTIVATGVSYATLLDLGLSSAISRYLAHAQGERNDEARQEVFSTSLVLYSLIGAAAGGIGVAAAMIVGWAWPDSADARLVSTLIVLLSLQFAIFFPQRVFIGALNACLRFDRTAILNLLTLAVRTALTIVLVMGGYGAIGLALAALLSTIPSFALSVYFLRQAAPSLRIDWRYSRAECRKRLFSYSVFSLGAQLADVVRFQLDIVIVAMFVGAVAVTHYRVAGMMVQYFIELMLALFGVCATVFSFQDGAKTHDRLVRTFVLTSKISLSIATFVGFGLILWGRPFIALWMGPSYLDSYPVLAILAIGTTVALWQAPSIGLLYGLERHRVFAWMNAAEGLANLALSLVLVRSYGMVGVALGTAIPMLITKLLVQPWYVCRVAEIPVAQYGRLVARTLAINVVALFVPAYVASFATPSYQSLVVCGIVSALAYAPVAAFALSAEERSVVLRAIHLPAWCLPLRVRRALQGATQP